MPGLEELTMRLQTAFGSRYENYSQLVAGFLHGQVSPEAWSEQIGEFVGESPLLVALHNEYILALLDQQEAIESPNVMPTSLAHLADHEARDAAEEEALAQQAAQAWRPPMLVESLRELNLLEVVLYAAEAGLNGTPHLTDTLQREWNHTTYWSASKHAHARS
ncbi:uncharacterized protein MONBRDRAFT_23034 [Monosiga brevicollis MX1]|uniref:Uncharacterized protein n=1 Tax=Monosiga brevicollis TaxID=81824 RepID=A9UST7_MONBE|nr:uncharacterized protein MONBRDRAFT_23034 [Monosiga brevicollis MX1]EDQ91835.1 predicted protein [Monosiga brevicollis MX1]|eukprot:XP_001743121.1 hypothetical protein [Monosiga brevicollis MX1]